MLLAACANNHKGGLKDKSDLIQHIKHTLKFLSFCQATNRVMCKEMGFG